MNSPIILFRNSSDVEEEFQAAQKNKIPLTEFRTEIPSNSLVIGRYSVLPYYNELSKELELQGSRLINNYNEHLYIADIENWYQDLKQYTPQTWFTWSDLEEGSYVVKGRTNSRKHEWNKRMFAPNLKSLRGIINSLLDDCLLSEQGLCIRKYVPLKKYDEGINQMPITNEWRFFFYKTKLIHYGYYWSFYEGERPKDIDPKGFGLACDIAKIASEHTNFFVVDVAETENEDWILIELNDGQMSGLSCIDSNDFYKRLSEIIV